MKTDNTRYADNDPNSLVNLRTFIQFSEWKITTSSGNFLGKVEKLHVVSLLNLHLTSPMICNELMFEFELSEPTRRLEITNYKTDKGTDFVRTRSTNIFGFADQETIT